MNKQWSSEELALLQKLSQTYESKRWKKISRQFLKQGFHRSEYDCRNKWVNHLDPTISHLQLTEDELRVIYQEYDKHKSQWALIQKALPHRTQIKIRNQFYGVIRNLVRFLLKYFKKVQNHWSQVSNKIRPETLQNLYRGEKQFEFAGPLIRQAIYGMKFKFSRIEFVEIIEKNQKIFSEIHELILATLIPKLSAQAQSSDSRGQAQNEEIIQEAVPEARKNKNQQPKNVPQLAPKHSQNHQMAWPTQPMPFPPQPNPHYQPEYFPPFIPYPQYLFFHPQQGTPFLQNMMPPHPNWRYN